jgi:hypothetical protein
MTTLEDLDRRHTDVEGLVTDLPEIINLRFERTVATQSEVNARLNILDKQMATLTRDLRDMRGAVTRQLLAQDQRLKGIDETLQEILAALPNA